jgi:hypothetical protein
MNIEYSVNSQYQAKLSKIRYQNSGLRTIKFDLCLNPSFGRGTQTPKFSCVEEDMDEEIKTPDEAHCESLTCKMFQDCVECYKTPDKQNYNHQVSNCFKRLL